MIPLVLRGGMHFSDVKTDALAVAYAPTGARQTAARRGTPACRNGVTVLSARSSLLTEGGTGYLKVIFNTELNYRSFTVPTVPT